MQMNLIEMFNEYQKIFNNYNSKKVVDITKCNNFSPVTVVPLLNLITEENIKKIEPHENPRINEYLHDVFGIKKMNYNYEYVTKPLGWLCPDNDNSKEIIEAILRIMQPDDLIRNELNIILQDLIYNAYNHVFTNGIVMSQFFPKSNEQEYVVFDNGKPIKDLTNCDELIKKNFNLNDGINTVTRNLNGNILFVSGKCCFEFSSRGIIESDINEYFQGTLISFRFK